MLHETSESDDCSIAISSKYSKVPPGWSYEGWCIVQLTTALHVAAMWNVCGMWTILCGTPALYLTSALAVHTNIRVISVQTSCCWLSTSWPIRAETSALGKQNISNYKSRRNTQVATKWEIAVEHWETTAHHKKCKNKITSWKSLIKRKARMSNGA